MHVRRNEVRVWTGEAGRWGYFLVVLGMGALAGAAARGPQVSTWLLLYVASGAALAAIAQQSLP